MKAFIIIQFKRKKREIREKSKKEKKRGFMKIKKNAETMSQHIAERDIRLENGDLRTYLSRFDSCVIMNSDRIETWRSQSVGV